MPDPQEAFDILVDPVAFHAWCTEQDLDACEARRRLNAIAEQMGADEEIVTPVLRQARRAHARRGHLAGGRSDVDELCAFVQIAAGLPARVKEAFRWCIIEGLSHAECAERMGISKETVRTHLRRLRILMRRCSVGVHGKTTPGSTHPGSWRDRG